MYYRCDPHSHTNYRHLSTPEKIIRMKRLHTNSRVSQQRIKRLTEKLAMRTELNGVIVDSDFQSDLSLITKDATAVVMEKHPPGSFERIFWEQQTKAHSMQNARSMKWHPLMIRWCIYLRHLSDTAYDTLRASNAIKLPSQRTVRNYTYYTSSQPGFSASVDKQIQDYARFESERDKYVVLLMDEMHIRDDIIYDKYSGISHSYFSNKIQFL